MAFYTDDTITSVTDRCDIGYLDRSKVTAWNRVRGSNELRALTGWYWVEKSTRREQGGFKTYSAAVRDAYYKCVSHSKIPSTTRSRLRKVA